MYSSIHKEDKRKKIGKRHLNLIQLVAGKQTQVTRDSSLGMLGLQEVFKGLTLYKPIITSHCMKISSHKRRSVKVGEVRTHARANKTPCPCHLRPVSPLMWYLCL